MRVDLRFPLPPTTNDLVNEARTNKYKSAATKKYWTTKVAGIALKANSPRFNSLVWVAFEFYVKNFARDHDNLQGSKKYLMDGLVEAGVIKKDNLTIIQPVVVDSFVRTKEDDHVIVTISDCPIFEIKKII